MGIFFGVILIYYIFLIDLIEIRILCEELRVEDYNCMFILFIM